MSVLRAKGYDGASLNELASAAGLQKASLYHRFPGGKQEIARAVLQYVDDWVKQNIYVLLADQQVEPAIRLEKALHHTRKIYEDGQTACLLRALSTDSGLELFRTELKGSMERWMKGFKQLGLDFGLTEVDARQKATEVLVLIQGSLVIANTFEEIKPFQDALAKIKKMYLQ